MEAGLHFPLQLKNSSLVFTGPGFLPWVTHETTLLNKTQIYFLSFFLQ